MRFNYMDGKGNIITSVYVDNETKEVTFKNYTDRVFIRPFGEHETATYDDVMSFFEHRTFPRNRINIDDILKQMHLKTYDPYVMCKKLKGRTQQDDFWIDFLED